MLFSLHIFKKTIFALTNRSPLKYTCQLHLIFFTFYSSEHVKHNLKSLCLLYTVRFTPNVNLNSVSRELETRYYIFYATNNFLTILESIYKLFSETNWKLISINHSNSFKVKISYLNEMLHMHVWSILKLLEYMASLCEVVPIFSYFSLFLSSFRASACAIFAFSIILPTQILSLSTETEATILHIQYLTIHF